MSMRLFKMCEHNHDSATDKQKSAKILECFVI